MKRKRFSAGFSAFIVSVSTLISAVGPAIPARAAAAQTCVWAGTAGDKKFSSATNWTGCGDAAPNDGDIVSFDASVFGGEINLALTNDTNPELAKVTFHNSDAMSGHHLYLSQLTLADNGVIETTGTYAYVNIGIPGATYEEDVYADLVVKGDYKMISSTNQYRGLKVDGKLIVDSSYLSPTVHLDLSKNSFGSLAVLANKNVQFTSSGNHTITAPITLVEGAGLSFFGPYGETISGLTWNFTGTMTLNFSDPIEAVVGEGLKVVLSGSGADSAKIKRSNLSTGELVVGDTVQESVAKTTEVAGAKPDESLAVGDKETAIMTADSTRGNVTVIAGGILKGTGTAQSIFVRENGIVAPGMSPGCLTTGTFSLSGEYLFELGGTEACTSYDQIKVTDPAATDASVYLNATSVLTTSRFEDYTPTQGQIFTIIDNQGAQAVDGTFKDLAEGATFEQNGVIFKISYVGGDGNDVTLTVQNVPTTPDTGFELIRSNPLITGLGTVVAALLVATIARRRATK